MFAQGFHDSFYRNILNFSMPLLLFLHIRQSSSVTKNAGEKYANSNLCRLLQHAGNSGNVYMHKYNIILGCVF